MTELRVFNKDGVELGYVSSKVSHWFMDADGVLFNDELIDILITVEGIPQYIELYGKMVRRSRGYFTKVMELARVNDLVRLPPGRLRLNVFPLVHSKEPNGVG